MPFIDKSAAAKAALDQAVELSLTAAGELLYAAIFPLIPTGDTTALKTSLAYKVDLANSRVTIGVNTPYAIYVEFGTGIYAENGNGRKGGWVYSDPDTGEAIFTLGSEPQPFMRPGYEDVKETIKKVCGKYLGTLLGKPTLTIKKVK